MTTGDLAFDALGDLILTASWFGETRIHRVAAAAVPRTQSTTAMPFTVQTTSAVPVISGSVWSGAVGPFAAPSVFLGVAGAGSGVLYRQVPGVAAAPTPTTVPLADGSTDLASCDPGDVITVRKDITSRFGSTDQFAVAVTGATGTASVTSTGGVLGAQTGRAALTAPPGTYTVSESAASGLISDYSSTLTCTRRATGVVVATAGSGVTRTLEHPGGAVDCLWANRSVPTLTVSLTLSRGRFIPSDQLTVHLRTGSPSGPVVGAPGNGTTAGTTSIVTAGTGTTGKVRTTAGTVYHVTVVAANPLTEPVNYTSSISCVDPSGLQPDLPTGQNFDEGFSLQVVDGAQITCLLDHRRPLRPRAGFECGAGEIYAFNAALTADALADPESRRVSRVLVSNPPAGALGSVTSSSADPMPLPATGGYISMNAAAIAAGGRYLYYVAGKSSGANDFPAVMRYDTVDPAAVWTPQTFDNPSLRTITRGGLNPTNGILYLSVSLAPPLDTQHDFWAFDTLTNTMIGYVGRWTGPEGINGDLVFDQSGNMMLVIANDLNGSLIRIENMPTTARPYGTEIGSLITARTMVFGAAGLGSANGAAFDGDGYLYLSTPTITGVVGTSFLRRVDPNDGTVLSTVTVEGMTDSEVVVGDLADCNDPGAIKLSKNLVGRVLPSDQFSLVISPPLGSVDLGNRTTTTGNSTGLQPTVAGPIVGVPGRVYTLTEVATAGGNLAGYDISVQCRDLNHAVDVPVVATGTVGVYTVTFPQPDIDGVLASLDCVVTNTPTTRLTVRKALGSSRVVATDQFSVWARPAVVGASDLPIVLPATSRTTAGATNVITADTGTTGPMPVTPGSTYTFGETGAGTPVADLDRYTTLVTCVDNRTRQTGLPTAQVFTVPLDITPVLGAHLTCTLTNRLETTIRLGKELARDRVDPADQFTVDIRNQAGVSQGIGTATTTGTGAVVDTGSGSRVWTTATAGQTATVRELKTVGPTLLSGYDTTIQCLNGWTASPTVLPSGAGQVFSVTPTTGDRITCTLVNSAFPVLATGIGLLTVNGAALVGGRMIKGSDVLGYRTTVGNTGKAAGTTELTATVPANTVFSGPAGVWTGCVDAPVPSPAGTVCTRTVTVAPSATQLVDFAVRADPNLAGVLSISAAVGSSEGSCVTCSTTMATAAILTASKVLTTVDGSPAVAGQAVEAGDDLVYTLTVTNTGGTVGTAALTEIVPPATVFADGVGEWTNCLLLPTPSPAGTSCSRTLPVPAAVVGTPGSASATFVVSVLDTPPTGTTHLTNTLTATAVADGVDLCLPAAPCTVQNPIRPSWTLDTRVSVVRGGVPVVLTERNVARPGEVLTYEVTAVVLWGTVSGLEIVDDLERVLDDSTLTGPATLTIDGGAPQPVAPVGTLPQVRLTAPVGSLAAGRTAVLRYQVTVDADAWAATLRNAVAGTGSEPPSQCHGVPYVVGSCRLELVSPAWVLVHNLGDGLNGPVEMDGAEFVVLADDGGEPGAPLPGPAVEPTGATGRFVIPGLDPGRYWLRQTRALPGRALLAHDVAFTVEVIELEPRTEVVALDTDPNSPVTVDPLAPDTLRVLDSAPFALPFTGGTGTDWLRLCGILLMAVALVRLVRFRRAGRPAVGGATSLR